MITWNDDDELTVLLVAYVVFMILFLVVLLA